MITVHAVLVVTALAGGVAIYLIGTKARPVEGARASWMGWLALYVLGIIASLFMVGFAVLAFFAADAVLSLIGLRPTPGSEMAVLWMVLAAPAYFVAFLAGLHTRSGRRPDNAMGDAR